MTKVIRIYIVFCIYIVIRTLRVEEEESCKSSLHVADSLKGGFTEVRGCLRIKKMEICWTGTEDRKDFAVRWCCISKEELELVYRHDKAEWPPVVVRILRGPAMTHALK